MTKSYKEIMNDINKILEAVEYYETKTWEINNLLAPWFQVIDLYTNNYPKDLLIIYIYLNLDKERFDLEKLLNFIKSLVRYCYSVGSTTNIKYYIYDLTVKVIEDKFEEYFDKDYICPDYFGMLYKGFGLLGVYLDNNQKTLSNVTFFRLKDLVPLPSIIDSNFSYIGNTIPCDISKYEINRGKLSSVEDLNKILLSKEIWNKESTKKRVDELKFKYENFFKGNNEN